MYILLRYIDRMIPALRNYLQSRRYFARKKKRSNVMSCQESICILLRYIIKFHFLDVKKKEKIDPAARYQVHTITRPALCVQGQVTSSQ